MVHCNSQRRRRQEERGVWYSQSWRRPGGRALGAACLLLPFSPVRRARLDRGRGGAGCTQLSGFPSQATALPLSTFRKGARCFKLLCTASGRSGKRHQPSMPSAVMRACV